MIDKTDFEILKNIHRSRAPEERKAYAIFEMTRMATINSINKDNLLDMVKWLLPIAFDLPIEPATRCSLEQIETEELKPCPFCGGVAHLYRVKEERPYCYVECQSCYARTDGKDGKQETIKQWNGRSEKPRNEGSTLPTVPNPKGGGRH